MAYPETRRVDQTDIYHGRTVPDPYRWLEEDVRESAEVAAWAKAQNEVTRKYLDAIPQRQAIHDRLTELWNYERQSVPWQVAGQYFYFKNDGLQDQPVLLTANSYDEEGRVLIDPNKWSEDGTVALGRTVVSEDGQRMAYTRKEAGSDWSTVRFIEIDSGKVLEDKLEWVRHGNLVWNAACDGLYYTRYPEPPEGEKFQALSLNPMIYFHKLGTPQSEDTLIFRRPDEPNWSFWLRRTEDNRYLVLTIHRSTDPQSRVYLREVGAAADAPWNKLIDNFDHEYSLIGNRDATLYFYTDRDAPRKRVIAIDANAEDSSSFTEVIPEREQGGTLEYVALFGDELICNYLSDVTTRLFRYDLEGEELGAIELPGLGNASGFGGRQDDTETFYSFTSYTMPTAIYRYDVTSGKNELIRSSKVDFDPKLYESKQVFATSKDGTQVPIIVSYKKGPSGAARKLDHNNPTLLYGYGGFNISLTPSFAVTNAAWMDMGGIYAVANLRGGGEYGEAWHAGGKSVNKQNVFDDFIAAAEHLISTGYTKPEKLAIMGGSNGGLLVGAAMTQRPELFGACLPAVGVMDMLRFQNFTAGHFWRHEYGTADDPEEFAALIAYSPYHNLKPDTHYPATLVTTADTDDRVVPMHSFKFAAELQHDQAGDAPVLIRIESKAGHGAGTPVSKRIDLVADKWAFLWKSLKMAE
ncbi:prolyl oligopeptidase family serine peptidase [Adhaeretor mobilis]|uniref:prolyl oligopeptidase family serine peptidase n=1 Tax=Adhaeretor mobilis TaxID=1930276 RepID=UPI001FE26EC9|nr:prolyl oligopeptidase family serine peptidase [Adhaeretor mobilis]